LRLVDVDLLLLDIELLLEDEDVVLLADGGGVVQAAVVPVVGTVAVANLLGRIGAAGSVQPAHVNGYPALIIRIDGEVAGVLAVRMEGGLITGLYAVRNPEKLSHLRQEAALQR